jgi:hypothetical protein
MNKIKTWLTSLMLLLAVTLTAQSTNDVVIGKWKTEDNTIIEIYVVNSKLYMKQISATKKSDIKNNGKLIGKNFIVNTKSQYNCTLIDPSNLKEYTGLITRSLI